MSISVRQLHPVVGCEIDGVDLRNLSEQDFEGVREALYRHQVALVRGQQLDKSAFLDFARRFGEPEVFRLKGYGDVSGSEKQVADLPLVQRLTNLTSEGKPMGPCPQMDRMSIAENWHSDSSYRAVPSFVTLLHGIEVPNVGGDTHFTSLHAAYDAVPDALRSELEELEVVHNWEYQRTLAPGQEPISKEERDATPPVIHRLVQRHPQTGRKLLFLSASAEHIVGWPYDKGRALLDELMALATRPEAIYTHRWQPLDIVLWDNRATLHRAGQFDYRSTVLRRFLHRVVIAGDSSAYPAQVFASEAVSSS